MSKFFFIFVFYLIGCQSVHCQKTLAEHKDVLLLMGSRFEITAIAESKDLAMEAVALGVEEVRRIETLISSWDSLSQTSEINRNAGVKAVTVDIELFELIRRSIKVSELTQGAFDISFAGVEWLYAFDKREHKLPVESKRLESVRKIDYRNIKLNPRDTSVFLLEKGSKIGFGAIGKGYAANRAKEIMKEINGVHGGLVNASGDLIAWGLNGETEKWNIQISNPENIHKTFGWLELQDMSIVTSGNYEKYFMCKGTRYAHIIDPRSGLPTTGIKSVSVICPDAELGDALATSIFVLGKKKGLDLVNNLKNIEALIIDDSDDVFYSKNLNLNKK